MTVQACTRQGFLMIIGMAGQTCRINAQVGSLFNLKLLIGNIFCAMTILASLFGMRYRQWKPGQIVIEPCHIKAYHLKVLSIMVTVAVKALFTLNRNR